MQIATRPYLAAGLALASAAAVTIPIATSRDLVTPAIPSSDRMVALTASALPTALLNLVTIPQDLAGGALGSLNTVVTAYPDTALIFGTGLLESLDHAANHPSTIPLAIASLPASIGSFVEVIGLQTTGVAASGYSPISGKYQMPGEPDPVTYSPLHPTEAIVPVFSQTADDVFALPGQLPGNIVTAVNRSAQKLDDVSAALGGPRVVHQTALSLESVGTSVIQAEGLVRTATLGAVSSVAVTAVNKGDVAKAVREGRAEIKRAIFGRPASASAPAGSAKQLGAIKTVKTTVQKAQKDIRASFKPNKVKLSKAPTTSSAASSD